MKYELILKNNKSLGLDVLSWFITSLNFMGFMGISTWVDKNGIIGAVSLVLVFLVMRLLKKESYRTNFLLLLTPVIPWLIVGIYAMAIASFGLAGLFYFANKPKLVQVAEEGIVFPAIPSRNYGWKEVQQALLKDGLLTIDLKNNKLIQQLIEDNMKTINEQDFNEFCREQLNKSH